ncbi:MAG: hypothetical protein ACOC12_10010, partial [Bacteroidota bacterium]
VYLDGESGQYYIKRFQPELSEKIQSLIGDHPDSRLITLSVARYPQLKVNLVTGGRKQKTDEEINVDEFIGVKGYKAKGKRLSASEVESVEWLEPLTPDPSEEESTHMTDETAEDDEKSEAIAKPSESTNVSKKEDGTDSPGKKQITLDFE